MMRRKAGPIIDLLLVGSSFSDPWRRGDAKVLDVINVEDALLRLCGRNHADLNLHERGRERQEEGEEGSDQVFHLDSLSAARMADDQNLLIDLFR